MCDSLNCSDVRIWISPRKKYKKLYAPLLTEASRYWHDRPSSSQVITKGVGKIDQCQNVIKYNTVPIGRIFLRVHCISLIYHAPNIHNAWNLLSYHTNKVICQDKSPPSKVAGLLYFPICRLGGYIRNVITGRVKWQTQTHTYVWIR